ncbi:MAG: hypothetical protein NXH85_18540 [Pseudomonadaceae bacterium]|nr:hypothetical protein [Pseudomonadaceae bacterium]
MDVFTMVVVIVLAGIGYSCFEVYMKSKTKQAEAQTTDEGLLAELDAMRARIEVLEKILTDEKHSLKQQIDALERQP